MNTVKLREILRQVAGKAGLRYEEQEASLVESWLLFAGDRLLEFWDAYHFPDICALEEREPVTDVESGFKFIDMEAAGVAPMRDLVEVFRKDPRGLGDPAPLFGTRRFGNKFWLRGNVPDSVWVHFKIAAPVLGVPVADDEKTYAAGDAVYWDEPGDVYEALEGVSAESNPVDNPAEWERSEVPRLAQRWLVHAVYADLLREDGQMDKAIGEERIAREKLDDAILRFVETGERFVVNSR